LGEAAVVQAQVNQSIDDAIWNLPVDYDCQDADCQTIQFFPLSEMTVLYEVQQAGGCSASDSISIAFEDVRRVYLPTAFSPNADGRNDTFRPFISVPNVQSVASLEIFDRWGGLVYEKQDYLPQTSRDGWDGTKNGKPMPLGQYTYVARVVFLDGLVKEYSGSVRLIR
jgi:gliding motility-associated-like protein